MEETGAVVCVIERKGINVADNVRNEFEKCDARGRGLVREKYI